MIGIILTGHGSFAPGLMGAVEMIAGKQEDFLVVDFQENESLETFEKKMSDGVAKLLEKNESVIVFADLLGGTPFRTAMLAANNRENVQVVVGTNLPMLIESTGLRYSATNLNEFITQAMEIGREGLSHAQLNIQNHEETMEEGI